MSDLILVKETKYPNTCTKCGKTIPKGSECYWRKDSKENYHVQCKPSDTKQAPASKPVTVPTTEKREPPENLVGARLHLARRIVAEEFGISEDDISPESMVLYETFRQLYGEVWLKEGVGK